MPSPVAIHQVLAEALFDFEEWLLATGWRGKENDCVNLFASKFLFSRIDPAGPIKDPTQICIEVCVPQPRSVGIKKAVRKDLVIWSEPHATTWDENWNAVTVPAAIIEWKARRKPTTQERLSAYDLQWIRSYLQVYPAFRGYCATVDFTCPARRVFTWASTGEELLADFHRTGCLGSEGLITAP
jgi:hypothetical protein